MQSKELHTLVQPRPQGLGDKMRDLGNEVDLGLNYLQFFCRVLMYQNGSVKAATPSE